MAGNMFARQLEVAFDRDYPGLRRGSSFERDGREAEDAAAEYLYGVAEKPPYANRSSVSGPTEPNGGPAGTALRRLIEDIHDLTHQVASPTIAQKVNDLASLIDMEVHFLLSAEHD